MCKLKDAEIHSKADHIVVEHNSIEFEALGTENDWLSLDIDMDGRTIIKMHCICCGPLGECYIQIRMWNFVVEYAEKAIFKLDYGSSDVQQE